MTDNEIINWLLGGDVSIQYQTNRDLLNKNIPKLQKRITAEGWGADFLSRQLPDGHWGRGFYQVKWTSTHYTLLDLRTLNLQPRLPQLLKILELILTEETTADGGVNPAQTISQSDICVNGMFLNYACYFGVKEKLLIPVIDFMLSQQLPDGGFNCRFNRSGAKHSSLHSTLSVAEGFYEYETNGYKYRIDDIRKARMQSEEFMLQHQLFISDRTGEIINDAFLILAFPYRWKYDILRALDYFRHTGKHFDARMQKALNVILDKKKADGRWTVPSQYSGLTHFIMEKAGPPSRWNTLRCMRVLKHFTE